MVTQFVNQNLHPRVIFNYPFVCPKVSNKAILYLIYMYYIYLVNHCSASLHGLMVRQLPIQ
jgi:hypothetical protein